MSIANLLVPNNYNIIVGSITANDNTSSTFNTINVDTIDSNAGQFVDFIAPIHVDTLDASLLASINVKAPLQLSESRLSDPSSSFAGVLQQANATGADPGSVVAGGLSFFDSSSTHTIKSDTARNKVFKTIVNPYIFRYTASNAVATPLAVIGAYYSMLSSAWITNDTNNFTVNAPATNAMSITYTGPTRKIFLSASFTLNPTVSDNFRIACFINPVYDSTTNVISGTPINGSIVRQSASTPTYVATPMMCNFTLTTGQTVFFGIAGTIAGIGNVIIDHAQISMVALSLGTD